MLSTADLVLTRILILIVKLKNHIKKRELSKYQQDIDGENLHEKI